MGTNFSEDTIFNKIKGKMLAILYQCIKLCCTAEDVP